MLQKEKKKSPAKLMIPLINLFLKLLNIKLKYAWLIFILMNSLAISMYRYEKQQQSSGCAGDIYCSLQLKTQQ